MIIKRIDELTDQQLSETIKIFFQTSSRQSFKSTDDKELFLYRYFGYYQENFPNLFFVAVHEKAEDMALGYVCGSASTFDDEALIKLQPQTEFFKEVSGDYPAHLHINVSPLFHGQGTGSKLMDRFEEQLVREGAKGLHIITAPEAANRLFYQKRGFDFELTKKINNTSLLVMGKSLIPRT